MRRVLTCHPATPCPAVEAIETEAVRATGSALALRYRLAGALGALVVPPPARPARADGLWEHTCFEAFVSFGGDGYLEFNVAPSGRWAAYRFDGYRQGMAPLEIDPPRIEVETGAGELDVRVALDLPSEGPVRIGLTAVIEAADGGLSYWALAHPPGRPDFHRAETRVLAL
ncbi:MULTISPECIES: DOMON-like domain-containing protein [unclassified Phenylobacterium]|uniref:DOMON-like domain-containing protein n=1 Tax=unclassified Phenylobacterium TaxID=2640670 RepID=UPI00083B2A1E|nr:MULTISPECIES: DOMON-like domain-containing protein [unclassified Phenylobacterium]